MDSAQKTIILVVNDDPTQLSDYAKLLEKNDYATLSAKNGESAAELIEGNAEIDLVLMDIDLGNGPNGCETAENILKRRDVPIVFLSDGTERDAIAKIPLISACGIIQKNAETETVLTSLRTALNLSAKRKAISVEHIALGKSDQNFKTILETSPDGIVLSSLNGEIQYLTERALSMAGYDSEKEVIGKNILDFIHPDFKDKATQLITEMFNGNFTGSAEYIIIRKDRSQFYSDINANILRDANGNPAGVVYIHRDVTERKVAEGKIIKLLAEKELILKEVHHRIKNNMAMLTSLLSLQGAMSTDPATAAVLEETENRVQCMATLYDRLYNSMDYHELPVTQFLPYLIDEIMANHPSGASLSVVKNIDDFILDVKKLQPLGIILNEILTYIMKHTYAEAANSMISISASITDTVVSIGIRGFKGCIPDPDDFSKGDDFALILVDTLTKQLRGTLRPLGENETGVVLTFNCN